MPFWEVPFVCQMDYSHGEMEDPLGCWYACVCMLGFSFAEGPRLGLPSKFVRQGAGDYLTHYPVYLNPPESDVGETYLMKELMRNEDLVKLQSAWQWCDAPSRIASDLQSHGPLMLTSDRQGRSTKMFSHCSILVGVKDDKSVLIHDPTEFPFVVTPLGWILDDVRKGFPVFHKNCSVDDIQIRWQG